MLFHFLPIIIYKYDQLNRKYLILKHALSIHRCLISAPEVDLIDRFPMTVRKHLNLLNLALEVVFECRFHVFLLSDLKPRVDSQVHPDSKVVFNALVNLFFHLLANV